MHVARADTMAALGDAQHRGQHRWPHRHTDHRLPRGQHHAWTAAFLIGTALALLSAAAWLLVDPTRAGPAARARRPRARAPRATSARQARAPADRGREPAGPSGHCSFERAARRPAAPAPRRSARTTPLRPGQSMLPGHRDVLGPAHLVQDQVIAAPGAGGREACRPADPRRCRHRSRRARTITSCAVSSAALTARSASSGRLVAGQQPAPGASSEA